MGKHEDIAYQMCVVVLRPFFVNHMYYSKHHMMPESSHAKFNVWWFCVLRKACDEWTGWQEKPRSTWPRGRLEIFLKCAGLYERSVQVESGIVGSV